MKSGLLVSVPALQLLWRLEDTGMVVKIDAQTGRLLVGPTARLTITDDRAIRKPGADPRSTAFWGCSWYGGGMVKLDTRSHLATVYPFPPEHEDGNCYETSVDKDGMVWMPFTHGDSIAKFDPTTEQWTSYFLPTIGTKTHGLQAVTMNGRTEIGMGYLGAGKVAKLEFRTREELQRLKAETRRP